jgi:hypothetical protein
MAHMGALHRSLHLGDIDRALAAAITEVSKLHRNTHLLDPEGKAARSALVLLAEALENSSTSTTLAPEAKAVLDLIRDPTGIASDLVDACAEFSMRAMNSRRQHLATFSVIFFRSTDHAGAIASSFDSNRGDWMRALQPIQSESPDMHLAVIPPSYAISGIEKLADEFGVLERLPCVLFLGRHLPTDPQSQSFWADLLSFKITRDQPYPGQLRKIYRTVYSQGALLPGDRLTVAADSLFDYISTRINPLTLLKLLTGALVGPGGVKAIEAVEPSKKKSD